jgi:hypothetical protein
MTCSVAGLPLRTALLYVVLFAAALWLYPVLWPGTPFMTPDSDSPGYLAVAQDLSDLKIDQLHGRAPGYPLLIALTGSSQSPGRALFLVSLVLHFASIWFLASALHHSGLPETCLSIFGLILLLPPYVEPAGYVLSENLAELMLVTGVVSLIFWYPSKKMMWIVISAVTFGYAGLTRPTYQVVGLALAGYIFIGCSLFRWFSVRWKDAIFASIGLIFGSVLIVGGYALHNYKKFGYFDVTIPKLGLTLSTKTWRFIERLPDEHAALKAVLIEHRNAQLLGSNEASMSIWAAVPELQKVTGLDYSQLSTHMLHLNLQLIQEAPLLYLQEVVYAFGTYWFPSSGSLANLNSRLAQLVWGILHFVLVGGFAYVMIVLFGTAMYKRKSKQSLRFGNGGADQELHTLSLQRFGYTLAGVVVLYTAVISCLIEVGSPRYRTPTDSLIIFMFFLGTNLWQRIARPVGTVRSCCENVLPT